MLVDDRNYVIEVGLLGGSFVIRVALDAAHVIFLALVELQQPLQALLVFLLDHQKHFGLELDPLVEGDTGREHVAVLEVADDLQHMHQGVLSALQLSDDTLHLW